MSALAKSQVMIRKANFRCNARKVSPMLSLVAAATACIASATATSATSSYSTPISSGLRNLGNTCYLNSPLQCAFHIPRVREIITSSRQYKTVEQDPAEEDETPTDNAGLQALRQLFKEMEQASTNEFPAPVAPVQLCRSLGIPVMEQQDSQEFWKLLLPALQLTELVDLYQGAYEDYISAVDGSGRERRREEPFLDLSLDVSCGSLLQSIKDMFGTPELLSVSEGNGWRPEKDAPKVDALKGSLLRVAGLPSLLQCHLKRFQYDWQTDVMSKVNSRFSFPKVLDLSSVCTDVKEKEKESTVYDLQAIVVHVGEYGSGHYYSYVRPDIRSNDWYRFNDHEITSVSFSEVVSDTFGGRVARKAEEEHRGLLKRIFGSVHGGSYGYGGRTSSAYMLQYVRRCDIPELYGEER